ncbi:MULTISPECIES: SRPBCC domain-containing protein [Rhodomicrobium]|uniref:SRPBCC domain-containing protein n=1 Tax=Rhodomicrobium TaxID=1068 RepID=UPI000B4A6062|nr:MULTISPECIES: SRPBCC domain-containing protein [Rhodomicrobium]
MEEFAAGIDIDAPPGAVWAVLVDVKRWPEFDPHCERIEGHVALGETLTVYTPLAPGRAIPVRISRFDPPAEFAWTGGLPLGMFTSVRTHRIAKRGSGSRLDVTEVLSGPMLKMVTASLPDLNEIFTAFCDGIKRQVEAGR